MIKKTMDARLLQARLLATNAIKHARIRQQMELFGYTIDRMQELVALIDNAEALKNEKKDHYSQKHALTQQMAKDVKALKELYIEHLTIARFTFRKDPYMQEQLALKGTRKRHWAGWLEQVNTFYTGAAAKGLTAMKKNGAIAEEIAQGKAMAEALLQAYEDKKSNTGNAQSATQQRDKVLREIDHWVRNFKKVAKVALEDDLQLLEALGIAVPSKV